MLNIDIWSDYACPYCYIGKTQLMTALEELEIHDYTIRHCVFILEPGKVNRPDRTFVDGLKLSDEKAVASMQQTLQKITKMARAVGLDYNLDDMRDVGTIDAHRLTLWAGTLGRQEALSNLLFDGYLCQGLDISSPDVLVDMAVKAGLPEEGARRIVTTTDMMDRVFDDFEEADEKEVDLVPHFIFNERYEVIGITTVENLKRSIKEAIQDQ